MDSAQKTTCYRPLRVAVLGDYNEAVGAVTHAFIFNRWTFAILAELVGDEL